jgi:hypothetical protein
MQSTKKRQARLLKKKVTAEKEALRHASAIEEVASEGASLYELDLHLRFFAIGRIVSFFTAFIIGGILTFTVTDCKCTCMGCLSQFVFAI